MSITLTLSGNQSFLKADYFPPIELTDGEYVCGLIDFQTFNSIPNVDESNNQFHYIGEGTIPLNSYEISKGDGEISFSSEKFDDIILSGIDMKHTSDFNIMTAQKVKFIPTGSYEIEDINNFLKKTLENDVQFSLNVNHNTLKSEIKCNRVINFNQKSSIGPLLGFSERILSPDTVHISDRPVNILKVNAIRIECNITGGAYINNRQVHTIHEFFPTTSSGYKIVEVPRNVIYLPVTVKSIHTLQITVVDQDGNLINFRGETITVRIHIKKLN